MAPEQIANGSPGITPLITGIVNDAQTLIRQQLTLFQTEIKHELKQTRDASIPLGIGIFVAAHAGITLCIALALFLVYVWPDCSYAGAFGIVGLLLLIIAAGFLYSAKTQFDAFSPLPEKSVEGLKENIQWKTKT